MDVSRLHSAQQPQLDVCLGTCFQICPSPAGYDVCGLGALKTFQGQITPCGPTLTLGAFPPVSSASLPQSSASGDSRVCMAVGDRSFAVQHNQCFPLIIAELPYLHLQLCGTQPLHKVYDTIDSASSYFCFNILLFIIGSLPKFRHTHDVILLPSFSALPRH